MDWIRRAPEGVKGVRGTIDLVAQYRKIAPFPNNFKAITFLENVERMQGIVSRQAASIALATAMHIAAENQ